MKLIYVILGLSALTASPAVAELPVPPQSIAMQNAQAFLFHAGAGDIYEITSSTMALQHSRNGDVRAFASMLIDHHTKLTNDALAAAKAGGVMPPPPELSPAQKGMITQLTGAGAGFDRAYLQQQVQAHQMALALMQGYAANGDTPTLRQGAQAAVPVVQTHLAEAQRMLAAVR